MAITKFGDPIFGSLLEDFFDGNGNFFGNKRGNVPAVNISEKDDRYLIDVAAPGLQKQDFNINIEGGMLTISAQQELKEEQKEDNYTRREFNYTSFQRSFSLPDSADSDNIAAQYADGVLRINVPKRAEARRKAPKKIDIK